MAEREHPISGRRGGSGNGDRSTPRTGILPFQQLHAMICASTRSSRCRRDPGRTRCSRRASICGSARSPIACARVSCPGAAPTCATGSSSSTATPSTYRRRGAGERLRLCRAADGAARAVAILGHHRLRQSQKLDRPARRPDAAHRPTAAESFDQVERGYQGPLYVEIAPRTFSIVVRAGTRLNQLRFRRGSPQIAVTEIQRLHERGPARARRRRAAQHPREARRRHHRSRRRRVGRADRLSRQEAHRPHRHRQASPPTTRWISGSRSISAAAARSCSTPTSSTSW